MALAFIDIRCTVLLVERGGRRQDALARAAALVEGGLPDSKAIQGFNDAYADASRSIASCRLVHRSDWSHIVDGSKPASALHAEFRPSGIQAGDLAVQLDYECVVEVALRQGGDAEAHELAMRFHRSMFLPDDAQIARHNRDHGTSYVEARSSTPRRSDERAGLEPLLRRLLEWRNAEAAKAADAGEASFMGLPDAWYDAGRYACIGGHVSTTVLGTEERGDRCLTCDRPVILIPPMDEAEFAAMLPGILAEALPQN